MHRYLILTWALFRFWTLSWWDSQEILNLRLMGWLELVSLEKLDVELMCDALRLWGACQGTDVWDECDLSGVTGRTGDGASPVCKVWAVSQETCITLLCSNRKQLQLCSEIYSKKLQNWFKLATFETSDDWSQQKCQRC